MFDEELDGALQFKHLSLRSEFRAIQILNAAGSIFHINPEEIRSHAHSEHAVRARWVAIYLIKEEIKPSFPWIGRIVGQHHTTVMYGWKKIHDAFHRGDPLIASIKIVRALYPNMPGDRLIIVRKPNVPLPRILEVVAMLLTVEPDDIYKESNTKAIVFPRQIATYLLREIGGWSLSTIAQHFSQDNTTALYSYRKINAAIRNDSSVRDIVNMARTLCLRDTHAQ
jgi:chromosomal replication initiation ATPase DnaA